MKKGLLFSVAIVAAVVLSATLVKKEKNAEYYQPRTQVVQMNDATGSINWMMNRMADKQTGEIDPADVAAAKNQLASLKAKNGNSSALGLQWTNMGPNNNGGRTRAILIDKDDPNIMWAGCVSGGLFKSTTGGSSWTPVDDFFDNLAVSSLCQAPNGDLYFGTGEGLYYASSGIRSQGILGGGIWKSTDNGQTWTVLQSTVPSPNSPGAAFSAVGKIEADPTNSNRLYAATIGGMMVSDDAGVSWTKALTTPVINRCRDLTVASNGNVWMKEGSVVYKSDNGDVGSYNAITGVNSAIASNSGRMRIAVAPQDPDYVYITTSSGNTFNQAWQTKDGGDNWTKIGERSAQLDPISGQAGFNHALAVSPSDKERIFFGGVEFYEWSANDGWQRVGSRSYSPTNPFYIHADNHEITFHPTNPNIVFVGNDGGIFKSTDNGRTWSWVVKEYVTTQYYNIAVGLNGEIMGGTQDNGTIYVNPNGAQPRSGLRTASISFRGSFVDGDGGYAVLSRLNPDVGFKAMQRGIIGRSIDNQESFTFVLDNNVDPNLIAGNSGFADFVTPFTLWEKLEDNNSWDSIRFGADTVSSSLGFGNGGASYTGTIGKPQTSTKFVPEGLEITAGLLTVTSLSDGSLTGDGTGTFNATDGTFSVVFNQPVSLEIRTRAATTYDAGDVVEVQSATNELPITHTLTQNLSPGDFEMIQDPVQSMFVVGVTGRAANPGAFDANEQGGIWMTRGALTNINLTPRFFHVGKVGVGITPNIIEVSADGDAIWVGTNGGRVIRYSNLNNARDSATTSVDDAYISGTIDVVNSSVIQSRTLTIPGIGGRTITDIAVNPRDPDKVVVTVGNYGSSNYIYYSSNATSTNPTFTAVQGDLPSMPVYTALFNEKTSNTNQVIIGTDLGIFTTEDISAGGNVAWTQENSGLANVPVFDLVQDRAVRFDLRGNGGFDGSIYAGTHGRGAYKTASTSNVISTTEEVKVDEPVKGLDVYPNPTSNFVKVGLELEGRSDVIVTVRDITGKLVKTQSYRQLDKDVSEIELSVSNLNAGNYVITVQVGAKVETAKFIINK